MVSKDEIIGATLGATVAGVSTEIVKFVGNFNNLPSKVPPSKLNSDIFGHLAANMVTEVVKKVPLLATTLAKVFVKENKNVVVDITQAQAMKALVTVFERASLVGAFKLANELISLNPSVKVLRNVVIITTTSYTTFKVVKFSAKTLSQYLSFRTILNLRQQDAIVVISELARSNIITAFEHDLYLLELTRINDLKILSEFILKLKNLYK